MGYNYVLFVILHKHVKKCIRLLQLLLQQIVYFPVPGEVTCQSYLRKFLRLLEVVCILNVTVAY